MVKMGTLPLGFSAGTMIASECGIIGGYRSAGIVPWSVEVHAAQAGTLCRVLEAVAADTVTSAVAPDEDTAVHVDADGNHHVLGSGRAWWVSHDDGSARCRFPRDVSDPERSDLRSDTWSATGGPHVQVGLFRNAVDIARETADSEKWSRP